MCIIRLIKHIKIIVTILKIQNYNGKVKNQILILKLIFYNILIYYLYKFETTHTKYIY